MTVVDEACRRDLSEATGLVNHQPSRPATPADNRRQLVGSSQTRTRSRCSAGCRWGSGLGCPRDVRPVRREDLPLEARGNALRRRDQRPPAGRHRPRRRVASLNERLLWPANFEELGLRAVRPYCIRRACGHACGPETQHSRLAAKSAESTTSPRSKAKRLSLSKVTTQTSNQQRNIKSLRSNTLRAASFCQSGQCHASSSARRKVSSSAAVGTRA
jgi:hypothetical protein